LTTQTPTQSYTFVCECGKVYELTDEVERTTKVINKGEANETTEPFGGSCNVCGRGKDGLMPVVVVAPAAAAAEVSAPTEPAAAATAPPEVPPQGA